MMDFSQFMQTVGLSTVMNLIWVLLALYFVRKELSKFDRAGGVIFRDWMKHASSSDRALYFGLRFLGICILLGLAVS